MTECSQVAFGKNVFHIRSTSAIQIVIVNFDLNLTHIIVSLLPLLTETMK